MKDNAPDLGSFVALTRSISEALQAAIVAAGLLLFFVAASMKLAPVWALIAGALVSVVVAYAILHRISAARSTLAVYENGLEISVRGKSVAFRYDQLTAITAKYTHYKLNHQYTGTKTRLEWLVEGRFSPCVYEGDFRRGQHGERVVTAAILRSCQAIERRLLAELERTGAVHWRDNVWLTADGIELRGKANEAGQSRLIPYREIGEWKIVDNQLRIWRTGEGLPCFATGNETENFGPLFGLFESLCRGTRSIDPTCEVEPELVGAGA